MEKVTAFHVLMKSPEKSVMKEKGNIDHSLLFPDKRQWMVNNGI